MTIQVVGIVAILLPVLGCIAILIHRLSPPAPALPAEPRPLFDVEIVRDTSVRPHLEALKTRNSSARDRARSVVHAHFDQARAGAHDFAEAFIGPLDSIKTIYLMGKGGFGRWWHEDKNIDSLRDHVTWNYEKHVTSGEKLETTIHTALEQFEADLRAHRNLAIQSITSDIATEGLPVAVIVNHEGLAAECDRQVRDAVAKLFSRGLAEEAAIESLKTVIASEGLVMASGALVSRVIFVRIAAIPVSTSAGGVVTGAKIGSVFPGVGTTAGATVGLLVGLAVDSYLSSRQVANVSNSVREVLNTTEHALMNGHGDVPGLERLFEDALLAQQTAIDRIIAQELHAAASPR